MIAKDLFPFVLSASILFPGLWVLWRMSERIVLQYGWAGYIGWYAGMFTGIVAGLALSWQLM